MGEKEEVYVVGRRCVLGSIKKKKNPRKSKSRIRILLMWLSSQIYRVEDVAALEIQIWSVIFYYNPSAMISHLTSLIRFCYF